LHLTLNSFTDYIVSARQSVVRNEAEWDGWIRDRVNEGVRDIGKSVTRLYEGTSHGTFDPTLYVYSFRHALLLTQRIGFPELILLIRYEIFS